MEHRFIPVARIGDLDARGRKVLQLGPEAIALVRVEGRIYAFDNSCPHRRGPLAEGELEGHVLYCPLHAWPFDVRTGECPANPRVKVRIYPVRVVGEEIQLGFRVL